MSRISVIIPHMNQPEYLHRCLESLAAQITKIAGTEVIVVDNGSRELPTEIIKAYPWARLETETDKGPGPARNKGIAVSAGDLLAFIDADCVADPQWLGSVERVFGQDPLCQVIGGDVRIGLEDESRCTALEAYESVFAYRQKEYIEKLKFSGTGNLAMRKNVFQIVGPFAGIGIAEDRDWGQRASQAGIAIRYVAGMIVYHPARKTFGELCKKWDRHIAHDFNDKAQGLGGRARWIALSIAVAISGIVDIRRILASDRINGPRSMLLASAVLLRIRLYRAGRMLGMALGSGNVSPKWNA